MLRDQWVPILEHLHLQELTRRTEADLGRGHHEQLVPQLQEQTVRHPLREDSHGHLMRTLARSSWRAKTLAAYHTARRVPAAQLGIDPSPELRRSHKLVLTGRAAHPTSAATKTTVEDQDTARGPGRPAGTETRKQPVERARRARSSSRSHCTVLANASAVARAWPHSGRIEDQRYLLRRVPLLVEPGAPSGLNPKPAD